MNKSISATLFLLISISNLAVAHFGPARLDPLPVAELTVEEVLDGQSHCNMPYIIRGLGKKCEVIDFTFENLAQRFPEAKIQARDECEHLVDKNHTEYKSCLSHTKEQAESINALNQFVNLRNQLNTANPEYPLAGALWLFSNQTSNNEILIDKEIACYREDLTSLRQILLLGTKNSQASLHAHPDSESYLIEFKGPKVVTLAAPNEAHRLGLSKKEVTHLNEHTCCGAEENFNFGSPRNPMYEKDFELYPELNDVQFYQGIIQDGDMLYIPARWFHDIYYDCEECIGTPYFVETCNEPCDEEYLKALNEPPY